MIRAFGHRAGPAISRRWGISSRVLGCWLAFAGLAVAVGAEVIEAADEPFHPSQLEGVVFFVESVHGLGVARCSTLDCFDAGENAPLDRQYCDLETFPDGCVRRWQDQSTYAPPRDFEPPEWTGGRDFGQDDHDKPGVRANCVNGHPCVEGGRGAVQERSLEIEPDQPVGPIDGAFSVFLVAKPVSQAEDFYYFGFAGSELKHRQEDDSLRLRIGFKKPIALTASSSVDLETWQLIEIDRDSRSRVRGLINGWDKTLGQPVARGDFHFRFLLSVSRGRAMHGQVAACLVVEGLLAENERQQVREYLGRLYGLTVGDGSPEPRNGGEVDLADGLLLHWPFEAEAATGQAKGGECRVRSAAGPEGELRPDCPKSGPRRVPGPSGTAFRFDGQRDHVRARNSSPELDQLFRMTVSAWVRTEVAGEWKSIVDKRDDLEDGWDLYLDPRGHPFVRIDDLTLAADTRVSDGNWHHLAGVYDGEHLLLYVDGRLDRSRVVGRSISLGTSGPLVVGRHYGNEDNAFEGEIDDVRIYGRALGSPEILALASLTEP